MQSVLEVNEGDNTAFTHVDGKTECLSMVGIKKEKTQRL